MVTRLWTLYALSGFILVAQPRIQSAAVYNEASLTPQCLPNGGIAQGARFLIVGEDLGPRESTDRTDFPLTAELAGVTVSIQVGGRTIPAYPVSVSASKVVAIAPSGTPKGDGTVSVTFRQQTSTPAPIRIVARTFGIYTTAGTRAAAARRLDGSENPVLDQEHAAQAGQHVLVTGTGLGAVVGDEISGPLPEEPAGIGLKVWVGNKQAEVFAAHRTDCCAGIDQVEFSVPEGIEGCSVPVAIEVDGLYSNYVTIPVARPGEMACPNPPVKPVQTVENGAGLGVITIYDSEISGPGFPSTRTAGAGASFSRVSPKSGGVNLLSALRDGLSATDYAPSLSCSIDLPVEIGDLDPGDTEGAGLNAGAELTLVGPGGTRTLRQSQKGIYSLFTPNSFFTAGAYTMSGPGGLDVGPFSVALEYPGARLVSTIPTSIPRNQDFTVRWTSSGGDGYVAIGGSSSGSCGRQQVSFSCAAKMSDGQITIPARILNQLPRSESAGGVPTGSFVFTPIPASGAIRRFEAQGLDFGFAFIGITQVRVVNYQ